MSFSIQGFNNDYFLPLNNYFLNGFEKNELVEKSTRVYHPNATIDFDEWYFQNIRMSYSDWQYKEPASLTWNSNVNIELVTFQINLKGSIFIDGADSPLMNNYQHNLFYSPAGAIDTGILKSSGVKSTMFFLQFTKETFLQLTQDGNKVLEEFNKNVIQNRPAMLSARNLTVEAGMLNIINNVVHCSYSGGMKKIFLLSKAMELLVLQAEAANALIEPSYKYIKSKHDAECIRYVREYVMTCLDNPPGLQELAKIAGINEYKLKRGFKEMFGTTVFGFVADTRLDIAKNELEWKAKKASEIANELGYASVQHFSNAFKKKFGVSPRNFDSKQ